MSPKNLTIGGDKSYAVTYDELNMYEVKIENNYSKVITTMTVMAMTEQEAYNNVALNGWTVVGVRLLKEKIKDSYALSADHIRTEIPNKVVLEDAIEYPTNQTSNNSKNSNNSGNNNVTDNLNLVPTSKELVHILTIHFDFGSVSPIFDDKVSIIFNNLSKSKDYVIFGNTDNVAVGKHATYNNNYELSYLRAEHIKKLLIEKGYNADRIKTIGLGSAFPVEQGKSKSSLKNRRVEIYGFRTQI